MNTPICDFVARYAGENALRLHMPGHKGKQLTGCEDKDITEIKGADSLYEADGIIAESERNASYLFGCDTFYSTEGSSQCIRAMLYLVSLYAKLKGEKAVIAAARNVHKTFLSAVAMLDTDVQWLYGEGCSYLSCDISADNLRKHFEEAENKPTAVYITSPDYLGRIADIRALSEVCKEFGSLLVVDNAHGAYLRFLSESRHPIDMGADLCCDSAHKTLSVLTGGAYLHLNTSLPDFFRDNAKKALAFFGSTSPSYLILQSLDKMNEVLDASYRSDLEACISEIRSLRNKLTEMGYSLYGDEELKITLMTKSYGYNGNEFADILREKGIETEFADPDFVVMMFTPCLDETDTDRVCNVLSAIEKKPEIISDFPKMTLCRKVTDIRTAMLSVSETVKTQHCAGRVLASASVSCPPAVPVVMCGEEISESAVKAFLYYGIDKCEVML